MPNSKRCCILGFGMYRQQKLASLAAIYNLFVTLSLPTCAQTQWGPISQDEHRANAMSPERSAFCTHLCTRFLNTNF